MGGSTRGTPPSILPPMYPPKKRPGVPHGVGVSRVGAAGPRGCRTFLACRVHLVRIPAPVPALLHPRWAVNQHPGGAPPAPEGEALPVTGGNSQPRRGLSRVRPICNPHRTPSGCPAPISPGHPSPVKTIPAARTASPPALRGTRFPPHPPSPPPGTPRSPLPPGMLRSVSARGAAPGQSLPRPNPD